MGKLLILLMTMLALIPAVSAVFPTDGLYAHYPGDTNSAQWLDTSGNARHGSTDGATFTTSCKLDNCYSGSTGYVQAGTLASFSSDLTMCSWYNFNSGANNDYYIYSTNAGANAVFSWGLNTPTGNIGFYDGVAWREWSVSSSAYTGWRFVCAVWDSSVNKAHLYVNNVHYASVAYGGTMDLSGSVRFDDLDGNNGLIDDTTFWQHNLTSSEISALWNGGAGLPYTGSTGVNILAENLYTGDAINTFNVTFTNGSFYETTTGNITLRNWTNGNYTFTLAADTYVSNVTTFEHINTTNLQISLVQNNKLYLSWKDEITLNLVQNVTFDVVGSGFAASYNTTNGTYRLTGLAPNNYTIFYENPQDLYAPSQYSFSIPLTSTTTSNVTLYMLNVTDAETVTLTSLNSQTQNPIEGDTFTMSRVINGELVVVGLDQTDVTGRVQFNYQANRPYYFTATKSGYADKNFTLDPIIFTSYDVNREPISNYEDDQDFSSVRIDITPSIYYNNRTNNVSVFFLDPEQQLVFYNMSVNNGSFMSNDSGTNAYGGYLSGHVNLTNAGFNDLITLHYCYQRQDGAVKCFTNTYTVSKGTPGGYAWISQKDETYGLGVLERILISVMMIVLFMGITAWLSNDIMGAVVGLAFMGIFTQIGFMPWWSAAMSLIMLVVYIVWRSSS